MLHTPEHFRTVMKSIFTQNNSVLDYCLSFIDPKSPDAYAMLEPWLGL